MNASINNTFFDEVPLNTSIDVKTELEESIPDETECLFSQYNEDVEYDCGIDHNKLYTVFPIKEENDPLSLDKNCNCEDLMFIKKEEQYQIKQEELDLADKTIDDSVLENVEDNIQNAKYMTLRKCKDNVLRNRLRKIFNKIDSVSSDGFNNDKTLEFEHDIRIINNDVSDRLVECNKQNINDAKKYTCNHCEKTFKSKYNMMHHNNIHIGKKSYHCTLCQKSFYRSGDLNRHFSIHIGEKRFKCNTCEKSFNNNGNLKKHLIIHTGEKKFTCNICLKTFNNSSNLKKHLTVHTGEKKFICNICLKSFNNSSNLTKHLIIHTGEKKFTCNICLKSFNQSRVLKAHLSIHTGEKKFLCNFCQLSFNQSCHLKSHLSIHTGQKKFTCDFCQKSFNRKDRLEKHVIVHKEEISVKFSS